MSDDFLTAGQFYSELGVGQGLGYLTLDLDGFFFRHLDSLQ